MSELDKKLNLIDAKTPQNVQLSAKYKRSYAFYSIYTRLPAMLNKIIEQMIQDKDEIADIFNGEETKNEIKEVVSNILQLISELQNNKELVPFDGEEADKEVWNSFIEQLGENNTYFSAAWFHVECYIYRRLKSIFEKTKSLKTYDYFRKQKDGAFASSLHAINQVVQRITDFYKKNETLNEFNINELESFFYKLLRIGLWGNLSISNGNRVSQTGNPFEELDPCESCILHDQSRDIWNCLKSGGESCTIDIIMDNAAYETFTDFLIADFILRYNFAKKVRFHCKAIPWCISDVMYRDFHWTIRQLAKSDKDSVRSLGKRLQQYVDKKQIVLQPTEHFWTSPYEFQAMQSIAPKLYADLATSHLLIFKGDMNYRKLFAEIKYPFDISFVDVLGVFRPTNLCTVRTVKTAVICHLPDGKDDEFSQLDPNWMDSGKYGVMHFAPKN